MTLVAFDFDGTLSDDEMIVLLGEQAGCAAAISDITERAMAGELSYAESLRERVALLGGLEQAAVDRAYGEVALRPGAGALLADLQDAGATTAILTGGFEDGVAAALERAGVTVDRILANRLLAEDGVLTGEVEGPLIEGTKDDALWAVADAAGVDREATIAVGDGANDVPMLDAAGLAVGFQPKPAVRPHCDVSVDSVEALRDVLADLGVLPPA